MERKKDLAGIREHFGSFPFVSQFPDAFMVLYHELDDLLTDGTVEGYLPVKIILATRC
jgi:trans-aconitate 3-methyltransferase